MVHPNTTAVMNAINHSDAKYTHLVDLIAKATLSNTPLTNKLLEALDDFVGELIKQAGILPILPPQ